MTEEEFVEEYWSRNREKVRSINPDLFANGQFGDFPYYWMSRAEKEGRPLEEYLDRV